MFLALAMGAFFAAPMAARVSHRWGPRRAVTLGMALEAIGILATTLLIAVDVTGLQLVIPLFVYGVGVGFATAQLTCIVLSDIPGERSGLASGANSTVRQVGSALGIAILGTVLFVSLGNGVHRNLSTVPGLPPAAVDGIAQAMEASAGQALVALQGGPEVRAASCPASRPPSWTRPSSPASSRPGSCCSGVVFSLLLPKTQMHPGPEHEPPVLVDGEGRPTDGGRVMPTRRPSRLRPDPSGYTRAMAGPGARRRRLVMLAAAVAVLLIALGTRMLAVDELYVDFDEDDYLRAGQQYATGLQAGDPGVFLRENYRTEHPPLSKIVTGLAIAPLPPAPEIPDAPTTADPTEDLPRATAHRRAHGRGGVRGADRVPARPRVADRRAVAGPPHLEHQVHVPGDARGGPGVLRPARRRALDAGMAAGGGWAPQGGVARGGRDRVRARVRRQVPVRRGRARDRRRLGAADAADGGGRGPRLRGLVPVLGLLALGAVVFLAANPYLWPDPSAASSRRSPTTAATRPRTRSRRPAGRSWQPLVWLMGSVPFHDPSHVRRHHRPGDHGARRDGLRRIWGEQRVFALWLVIGLRVPARLADQVAAVHPRAVRPAVPRRGPRDGDPAAVRAGSRFLGATPPRRLPGRQVRTAERTGRRGRALRDLRAAAAVAGPRAHRLPGPGRSCRSSTRG